MPAGCVRSPIAADRVAPTAGRHRANCSGGFEADWNAGRTPSAAEGDRLTGRLRGEGGGRVVGPAEGLVTNGRQGQGNLSPCYPPSRGGASNYSPARETQAAARGARARMTGGSLSPRQPSLERARQYMTTQGLSSNLPRELAIRSRRSEPPGGSNLGRDFPSTLRSNSSRALRRRKASRTRLDPSRSKVGTRPGFSPCPGPRREAGRF